MGCVTQSSDAPIWFPPPLRVLPGRHSASIILHKRERPDQLSIAAWRRVDQHGFPKGDSEEIPFALVPQAEDGQVANWRADFAADVRRHFYFRVFGVWRDSEGCGEIQQDAAWSFHLASATCRGIDATIVGTSNDDVTRGTPGPDVIVGSPRGDVISGMSGADLICSYEGNDRLLGNPGNDDLLGGRGRDELDGNQGRDRCQGGAGPDHLLNCEREGA